MRLTLGGLPGPSRSPGISANPRAYVETTIPSFYHDTRTSADIVVRRDWTRRWWANAPSEYELVTSEAVLDELGRGPAERSADRLALVQALPPPANRLRHHVMASDPVGDALHLALASYHKCEFLVTWNCLHLANAHKFGHIRRVNSLLGLYVPMLVTPLELLGGTDEFV